MINEKTQDRSQAVAVSTTKKLPAIAALVFGAFIVLGAGFANSSTVHDVAHDVRHAHAFPCH